MIGYIDAEVLQSSLQKKKSDVANRRYTEGFNDALLKFKRMIHSAARVDVAPIIYANWIGNDSLYKHCSNCGHETGDDNIMWGSEEQEFIPPNYCEQCGAKMKDEGPEDV